MHPHGSKIRAEHLQRRACVYIRQSTVFQVTHHRESTERQYNLRERALAFGWTADTIDIIDDDCVFRAKADTDSTARRTRIPAEGGQRFHAKAAADSTRRRPLSAMTASAPG
jgi:hypothetical protein